MLGWGIDSAEQLHYIFFMDDLYGGEHGYGSIVGHDEEQGYDEGEEESEKETAEENTKE